jgi:hypothetical protein
MDTRIVVNVSWLSHRKRWLVHVRGRDGEGATYTTKSRAVNEGRIIARDLYDTGHLSQLVVHNMHGRISYEHTYGNDPEGTKG